MFGPTFDQIKTDKTLFHKVCNSIGLLFMLVAIALLLFNWGKLPDTVPTHFNIKGEADGWGSKYSLIILPVIAIAFYLFLSMIENKPHHYNYVVQLTEQNVQKQYTLARNLMNIIKNLSTILLSFIVISTVFDARETPITYSNTVIFSIIGLLIVVTVVYLVQSIKNK